MQELIFYIILFAVLFGLTYLIRKYPAIKNTVDKIESEIRKNDEVIKAFVPEEIYSCLKIKIKRCLNGELLKVISEHNELYGMQLETIEDVLTDELLRQVNNISGNTIITAEQAKLGVKLLWITVKRELELEKKKES